MKSTKMLCILHSISRNIPTSESDRRLTYPLPEHPENRFSRRESSFPGFLRPG